MEAKLIVFDTRIACFTFHAPASRNSVMPRYLRCCR